MGSNADIVRRLYDSFNSGESGRGLIDPEIEYVNPPDAIEPGTRHGAGEWNRAIGRIREGLGRGIKADVERIAESGDRVAVELTFHVDAPTSGLRGGFRQSALWTIRDGRAVRMEWFTDPDRAHAILADRQ